MSVAECGPGPSYWHCTGRALCLSRGFLSVVTASSRAEPGDGGAAWLGRIPGGLGAGHATQESPESDWP